MCILEEKITWVKDGEAFLSPFVNEMIVAINDTNIYVKEKERHVKMVDSLYSSKNRNHNVIANKNIYVIAGSNGAGKTVLRPYLVNLLKIDDEHSVNIDFIEACNHPSFNPYNQYSIESQKQKIKQLLFTDFCKKAIHDKKDFAYECNLRKDQLINLSLFEEAGYTLNLIFILLESIDDSKRRVQHRLQKKDGNYVDENSIKHNFTEGLANLNYSFSHWDNLFLIKNFDTVDFIDKAPMPILHARQGNIVHCNWAEVEKLPYISSIPNLEAALTLYKVQPK